MAIPYSEITPYIRTMTEKSNSRNHIRPEMYTQHAVYRGLRDLQGNGVVTGLTEISSVIAKERQPDGTLQPCAGRLYYRGIDIRDLTNGFLKEHRFGFEETVYLLLFSKLPTEKELEEFRGVLAGYRSLPPSFARDMILKAPSRDQMNTLARSVLALYTYDDDPDNISIENVLRQCLQLIAMFPLLEAYGYQAYNHYHLGHSLVIRNPHPEFSTAENLLHLLRKDGQFSPLEAQVLDLALVLHAEHGGGNNSSFTTRVVTSSGTDTYSAIAAALGSLKGPRHGGANAKVVKMFADLKQNVHTDNRAEIRSYLEKLLRGEAFDGAGLIYGMGHAIYSVSDPRAEILRSCAEGLAKEEGREDDFALFQTVAELAPEVIAAKRKIYKGVSPNVDFYSGMVYEMLGIPTELFTPIFAMARLAGWSAHRIEELQSAGKIIRPAYVGVKEPQPYVPMSER